VTENKLGEKKKNKKKTLNKTPKRQIEFETSLAIGLHLGVDKGYRMKE